MKLFAAFALFCCLEVALGYPHYPMRGQGWQQYIDNYNNAESQSEPGEDVFNPSMKEYQQQIATTMQRKLQL